MGFRYEVLNPEVLDTLREIFKKPSTEWSHKEYMTVLLTMEGMRIVASHAPSAKKISNATGNDANP